MVKLLEVGLFEKNASDSRGSGLGRSVSWPGGTRYTRTKLIQRALRSSKPNSSHLMFFTYVLFKLIIVFTVIH